MLDDTTVQHAQKELQWKPGSENEEGGEGDVVFRQCEQIGSKQ